MNWIKGHLVVEDEELKDVIKVSMNGKKVIEKNNQTIKKDFKPWVLFFEIIGFVTCRKV